MVGRRTTRLPDYGSPVRRQEADTARIAVSWAAQSLCVRWAKPVHAGNLYEHYLQPGCNALKLGNVRFHDLRHTFATMNLSAGEHYMQVSNWLRHSSFVLTLFTYADYINEDEQAAPKVGRGVVAADNVTPLKRKAR
jgi:integrase